MTAPTIERPVKPAPVDLHKRNRTSHLQWVKIADIVPCPRAQREFKPGWAAELAAHFDLEGLGFLVVNKRDGHTYCIDGQHRIAALRAIGFSEDTVQCEVYEGLSEKEEARMFLRRNNSKQVAAFDKFNVALTGEYEEESTIRRLMLAQGIGISRSGVSCVTSLRRAFQRQHEAGFSKTIRVIRDAYGDVGFRAAVIDGVSLFLHRYDGQVDEGLAVSRLSATGVNGLLGLASVSERMGSLRQPKALPAMEGLIAQVALPENAVAFVEASWGELPRERFGEWASELSAAISVLNRLLKALRKESS